MSRVFKIRQELNNDPDGIGYPNTDQGDYDALVLSSITEKQLIPTHDIKSYLTVVDKYYNISQSADLSAQKAMFNIKEFGIDGFDMSVVGAETILTNMLDALLSDGHIALPDKEYILALGNKTVSRADQLGLTNLQIAEVMEART